MRELTHIDLFSGIGGFALAARWAGIKTVQFVEIDPFCQKVLQKNFPGVPIHGDIKTFTYAKHGHGLPLCTEGKLQESHKGGSCRERIIEKGGGYNQRPFLLTGGFPCQPFSCAGKRKGTADDRHLWPHMLRIIKEFNPEWIIGENVGGIINIKNLVEQGGDADMEDEADNGGEGTSSTSVLVSILDDLNQAGYAVQLFLIPACAVNAPHRRDRVWIVAHSNRTGCGASTSAANGIWPEVNEKQQLPQPEYSRQDCHAPDTSNQGLQRGEETGNTSINGEESRNELIGRCLGWEEPWIEVATRLCRVDARVSNRVDRLKSLGNAVVPQIPYLIMKAILEAENDQS